MKYYCFSCKDEVTIPKNTENMAQKVKIVCDECIDTMDGTLKGDFFFEGEDEDDLHDNDNP